MAEKLPIHILLVEDNPNDVVLLKNAFEKASFSAETAVVEDGDQALDYLRHRAPFDAASRPDLILLDLNLPTKNGYEVLVEIKNDPDLKRIPVVILTTSSSMNDIVQSYDQYANAFITKPTDFAAFNNIAYAIESFWMTVATLPPADE
jgi:CheY-like chemotaxis protein